MYCNKYRIFWQDFNRSYIHSIYWDHLRSQGHIDIVMKKHCCSCISNLTLKSVVGIQTDFSEKLDGIINVDPNNLVEKFESFWDKPFKTQNDFDEVEMILDECLRIRAITTKQYNNIRQKCDFEKKLQLLKKLKYSIQLLKCNVYKTEFIVVFVLNQFYPIIIQIN